MPDIGETAEVAWADVMVDDIAVAPSGDEWRVVSTEPGQVHLMVNVVNIKTGQKISHEPNPSGLTLIRPRVSVRDAVETIAQAFPDAIVGAALADTRNASTCESCGAWIVNHPKHQEWHEALADRLADLDALVTRLAGGVPS